MLFNINHIIIIIKAALYYDGKHYKNLIRNGIPLSLIYDISWTPNEFVITLSSVANNIDVTIQQIQFH